MPLVADTQGLARPTLRAMASAVSNTKAVTCWRMRPTTLMMLRWNVAAACRDMPCADAHHLHGKRQPTDNCWAARPRSSKYKSSAHALVSKPGPASPACDTAKTGKNPRSTQHSTVQHIFPSMHTCSAWLGRHGRAGGTAHRRHARQAQQPPPPCRAAAPRTPPVQPRTRLSQGHQCPAPPVHQAATLSTASC